MRIGFRPWKPYSRLDAQPVHVRLLRGNRVNRSIRCDRSPVPASPDSPSQVASPDQTSSVCDRGDRAWDKLVLPPGAPLICSPRSRNGD